MDIRPIRNEAAYDAALKQVEAFFDDEPEPGTPEADQFDLLAAVIAAYEQTHWAIEAPEPIDAIRHFMDESGYSQSDLAALLQSRSRASEILNRRRPLTIEMAWKLHSAWGIPAEILIRPYSLATTAAIGD